MPRIPCVASLLLLLGAGVLSSSPLNATRHPGDVIGSSKKTLTEVANNFSAGAAVNSTDGNVQSTTAAAAFQPTRPPAVAVKPGRCPIVGYLVHVSASRPQDRFPSRGPFPKAQFKHGFSSSSSESRSDSREGFGRHYHSYRHHGLRQRLALCRAPSCGVNGDCLGQRKCCAVPGCRMKCLRPLPFDQLPGEMKRFQP